MMRKSIFSGALLNNDNTKAFGALSRFKGSERLYYVSKTNVLKGKINFILIVCFYLRSNKYRENGARDSVAVMVNQGNFNGRSSNWGSRGDGKLEVVSGGLIRCQWARSSR